MRSAWASVQSLQCPTAGKPNRRFHALQESGCSGSCPHTTQRPVKKIPGPRYFPVRFNGVKESMGPATAPERARSQEMASLTLPTEQEERELYTLARRRDGKERDLGVDQGNWRRLVTIHQLANVSVYRLVTIHHLANVSVYTRVCTINRKTIANLNHR